ncbi:MAG: hypothetical protein D6814_13875 [Calditrichaeota bacterium]|nr:MAG: hypothetical protein D6814_13875 [Calditrichota bacterium]
MADLNQIRAQEIIRKFTGQFDYALDAKGRVNIPARIREVIDMYDMHTLTLRYIDLNGFPVIRAYPTTYYNDKVLGKLKDLEGETADETFAIMAVTASCHQVKIDSQGRLNIPDDLLKKLNIKKEIRFVGMGDFFDIWHPDVCDKFIAARMAARKNGQSRESSDSAGTS